MVSKFLVVLMLLWSYNLIGGRCQDMAALQEALKDGNPPACLQSIISCQGYLNSKDDPPPKECCAPLKEAMKKDMPCFCKLFNNDKILKSVNITRDEALKLPSHCDKDLDTSVCDKMKDSESPDGAPSSSESQSSPPDSESSSAEGSSASASASGSAPPPTESRADKMSHFGGFSFIAVVAIVVAAV